jgi:tetratricopeptide (TPR) repeat protein
LARFLPDVRRRLAQLSIIVEGKEILLREGDGLIDAGGQRRFDFDAGAADGSGTALEDDACRVMSILAAAPQGAKQGAGDDAAVAPVSPHDLLGMAVRLEDDGRLQEATEVYRTVLAACGPDAEINFRLAELLYRLGDTTAARERYYAVIELDEDYVEARANLGCVLAELGERELAIAAFEGALAYHADYADVHFHLARTLDELARAERAVEHWRRFVELAPQSPWASEARSRLGDAE